MTTTTIGTLLIALSIIFAITAVLATSYTAFVAGPAAIVAILFFVAGVVCSGR